MIKQRILEEIVVSAESVIQDHILIKYLAENILTDSLQVKVKQQELSEILCKSQQHLKSDSIIPIEQINKLVKEVKERKDEQDKALYELQGLLEQACIKASCQREILSEIQGRESERINKDDRRRMKGKTLDEINPQNGDIDSCPLEFDNLVCYFETGTSLSQHHAVASDSKDEHIQQGLKAIIQPKIGKKKKR